MELFRKKHSQYWWYDFCLRGKRFRGSTGQTNKARATKIAALKCAEVCDNNDPLPGKAPFFSDFSRRFLQWVDTARLRPKTKTYYRDGLRLLSQTSIAHMRLDAITNDQADRLNFAGPASTNCALRTLRRLLHKAEEWKLIRQAPRIRLVPEKGRMLVLDTDAERKLLAAVADCHWRKSTLERFRDIVILARDTGMRNEKELYAMRIESLDWDRRIILVPDSKTVNGIRKVPMSDRVYALLQSRCRDRLNGWVFPSKRSASGHLSTMAKNFRQARRRAGLSEGLVLYGARHDFGTRLLKKTGNLKLVMDTMGHIDVKTALKYQHPELEIARTALNELNAAVVGK